MAHATQGERGQWTGISVGRASKQSIVRRDDQLGAAPVQVKGTHSAAIINEHIAGAARLIVSPPPVEWEARLEGGGRSRAPARQNQLTPVRPLQLGRIGHSNEVVGRRARVLVVTDQQAAGAAEPLAGDTQRP
jgi:hypothetical protein